MCYYDHAVAMHLKLDPWSEVSTKNHARAERPGNSINQNRPSPSNTGLEKSIFAMAVVAVVCVSALAAVSPWFV